MPGRDPGWYRSGIWLVRRLLGRVFRNSSIWGVERPALETWTAILAFAPVVGWLGNPAWWRETLPRLAHYYMLNTDRRGSLAEIQIIFAGTTYEYSLPWHNAWVLIAVTVPAAILVAAVVGILFVSVRRSARPAAALFPPAFRHDSDRADAANSRARRGPADAADVLLRRGVRRLGDRLAGRRPWLRVASPSRRLDLARQSSRRLVLVPSAPGNWSRSTRSSYRITTS